MCVLFLILFDRLSPEADSNPWLQQSLTAAKKKKCSEFYCIKPTGLEEYEENDDGTAVGDYDDVSLTSTPNENSNLEADTSRSTT